MVAAMATAQELVTPVELARYYSPVNIITYNDSGDMFAIGCGTEAILWDAVTNDYNERARYVLGGKRGVDGLVQDKKISRKLIKGLSLHIENLDFTHDNKLLVLRTNGILSLYDSNNPGDEAETIIKNFRAPIKSAAFYDNIEILYSYGDGKIAESFDTMNTKSARTGVHLDFHTDVVKLVVRGDKMLVMLASGTIHLIDLNTLDTLATFKSDMTLRGLMGFSFDASTFVIPKMTITSGGNSAEGAGDEGPKISPTELLDAADKSANNITAVTGDGGMDDTDTKNINTMDILNSEENYYLEIYKIADIMALTQGVTDAKLNDMTAVEREMLDNKSVETTSDDGGSKESEKLETPLYDKLHSKPKPVATFSSNYRFAFAALSSDGAVVAFCDNNIIQLVSTVTSDVLATITLPDWDIASSAVFSPDGNDFLIGTKSNFLYHCDVSAITGLGKGKGEGEGEGEIPAQETNEGTGGLAGDNSGGVKAKTSIPQSLLLSVGYSSLPVDYYLGAINFDVGYRHYFWRGLQNEPGNKGAFYTGSVLGFGLIPPGSNFPYSYNENGNELGPPFGYELKAGGVAGYAYYWPKFAVSIFAECVLGVNGRFLYNNSSDHGHISTKAFVQGFADVAVGVQYLMLRLWGGATFDTGVIIRGFVSFGAAIPVGLPARKIKAKKPSTVKEKKVKVKKEPKTKPGKIKEIKSDVPGEGEIDKDLNKSDATGDKTVEDLNKDEAKADDNQKNDAITGEKTGKDLNKSEAPGEVK